jgi:hypothetical protein
MPPVGFELMISAGERPQTYALDRAATGTGIMMMMMIMIIITIIIIVFKEALVIDTNHCPGICFGKKKKGFDADPEHHRTDTLGSAV